MRVQQGLGTIILGLALASTALVCQASSTVNGIYIGSTPSPETLDRAEALNAARAEAALLPGAFVVCGTGSSMEPLYAPGTYLVVKPVAFTELKPGAAVLYYANEGHAIVHVLVTNTRAGWQATGLNNIYRDEEPVTPSNLAGIVVKAFTPHARTVARLASL
jgi:phage repressor protein C with HTH and peptisase S24 domain